MKHRLLALGMIILAACGESPSRSGPPTVVVKLVLEPSSAEALHLQVAGPGTDAFSTGGTGMLVESAILSDRIAVAVFGEDLQGEVGVLGGVAPTDAGLIQVSVLAAVDSENQTVPSSSVTVKVVVDTIS